MNSKNLLLSGSIDNTQVYLIDKDYALVVIKKVLFACNLSEFVLNRYPIPFKNTRFFVDGFHFASHKNCSPSYNSADHPSITKLLNTSLVEQKNSQLRFLKQTSPYLKFSKLIYSTCTINRNKTD